MITWSTLQLQGMLEEGASDGQTLDKLAKKALELQNQLDTYYQNDRHLRDMLIRATAMENVASMIHVIPPANFNQLIEILRLSIESVEKTKKKDETDLGGKIHFTARQYAKARSSPSRGRKYSSPKSRTS